MRATANTIVSAPVIKDVTLVLSPTEASILRRACNFNKTLGEKFGASCYGGYSKGRTMKSTMGSIGDALAAAGVDRY